MCDCSTAVGDDRFLAEKPEGHKTDSRSHLLEYYTPTTEAFVNEHYSIDLHNPYFSTSDERIIPISQHDYEDMNDKETDV